MKIVTISSKRQITIPNDYLLSLDLEPRARLIMKFENGTLLMKPLKTSIVEQTAGSLKKYVSPSKLKMSFFKILQETKKKTAKRLAKKL